MFFKRRTKVLFVCTENICRSPLAEGLMRHHLRESGLASSVTVASAGTLVSMRGARPDPRAEKIAAARGVKLGSIRARRVSRRDLVKSDYIFAMDHKHEEVLMALAPPEHHHKIALLLSHPSTGAAADVPDPYYGSADTFTEVYRMIEEAVIGLLPLFRATR